MTGYCYQNRREYEEVLLPADGLRVLDFGEPNIPKFKITLIYTDPIDSSKREKHVMVGDIDEL